MTAAGLLVVGTDTGVGKTRIAAAIARCLVRDGHRVGVLKPVATGAVRQGDAWVSEDAALLIDAIGGDVEQERVAPIVFEEPLAPVVAARLRGTPLEQSHVLEAVRAALAWWAERADVMVVEGVGGLLCPLAEGTTVADLAIVLDYPLVVVARRGLGTLNHTLLTLEAARRRGLRIAGLVLNGAEPTADPLAESTNPGELARRLDGVALLADLEHVEDPSALSNTVQAVDWYGSARPPRTWEPAADRTEPSRDVSAALGEAMP
jgi:dethiobiotin synthetase